MVVSAFLNIVIVDNCVTVDAPRDFEVQHCADKEQIEFSLLQGRILGLDPDAHEHKLADDVSCLDTQIHEQPGRELGYAWDHPVLPENEGDKNHVKRQNNIHHSPNQERFDLGISGLLVNVEVFQLLCLSVLKHYFGVAG